MRGRLRAEILHKLTEAGILTFTNRAVEAHGLTAHVEYATGLFGQNSGSVRELLGGGIATELVEEFFGRRTQLGEHIDHVNRDPNCTGLIGNRPRDCLANPPCRIR